MNSADIKCWYVVPKAGRTWGSGTFTVQWFLFHCLHEAGLGLTALHVISHCSENCYHQAYNNHKETLGVPAWDVLGLRTSRCPGAGYLTVSAGLTPLWLLLQHKPPVTCRDKVSKELVREVEPQGAEEADIFFSGVGGEEGPLQLNHIHTVFAYRYICMIPVAVAW